MTGISLLTSETIKLTNYPSSLLDARLHVEMLEILGKSYKLLKDDEIEITQLNIPSSELIWDKRSIRNTLLILGALVTVV